MAVVECTVYSVQSPEVTASRRATTDQRETQLCLHVDQEPLSKPRGLQPSTLKQVLVQKGTKRDRLAP